MLEPVYCTSYSRRDNFQKISKYVFPAKFLTISEHFSPAKHFSWSIILLKSEILVCRPITLDKKGQFCESLKIFDILEFLVLSAHFQKSICNEVFSSEVSSTLQSCNFIKRELHCVHIFEYFLKVLVQLFENICDRVQWSSVNYRLWSVNYSPVF